MKKLIKKSVIIFTLLMAVESSSFGQEYIQMERSKIITLSTESDKSEVKIPVSDAYNYLKIKVEGQFKQGDVLIEIVDPNGVIKKDLSIKSEVNDSKGNKSTTRESVNGEMEKTCRNPDKGDWLVRITPKKGVGQIRIYSMHIFNPRTDLLELDQIEKDTNSNFK